jgi:hypothetical protein
LVLEKLNRRDGYRAASSVPLMLDDRTVQSPVLLADIPTPDGRARVLRNLWSYLSIPSIAEIVHIHSTRRLIEDYARRSNYQWPDEATAITTGCIHCRCLSTDLPLDDSFGDILLDRTSLNGH